MLELPGQPALSDFRIRKLTRVLQRAESRLKAIASRYTYFVHCQDSIPVSRQKELHTLLLAGTTPAQLARSARQVFIVPRPGTISPWSSKATDILHICGFESIERIERGICYALSFASPVDDSDIDRVAALLHDRMTEVVLHDSAAACALFEHAEPAAVATIDVSQHGGAALHEANAALGLALSEQEVDYLLQSYAELERDPTDAELMMFAQANSEHCRHKIFNASWTIDGERQDKRLFGMIKSTTENAPDGVISAYSDNAAVIEGWTSERLVADPVSRAYGYSDEPVHILMKVETHNHPTAISPFPGAATGAGGEIRDEGATGLGAKPKAGLTGFHRFAPAHPEIRATLGRRVSAP